MNQTRAFLDDILAHPEDDARRLVFADWLDDSGDPARAEFIRVQIELAKPEVPFPRRRELQKREFELLAQHGKGWSQPLVGRVKRWKFRRGFVEQIKTDIDSFIREAEFLFGFAPIQELDVVRDEGYDKSDDISAELVALAKSPWLARLRTLDLSYNWISDIALAALADSPHAAGLTHLDLTWTHPGREGLSALAQSARLLSLAQLDLSCNDLDRATLEAFASSCRLPKLAALNLMSDQLDDAGLRPLLDSPLAAQINTLCVDAGARLIAESTALKRLEDLDLIGSLHREAVEAFAKSAVIRQLRRFRIIRTGIGDTGVQALAEGFTPGRLEDLELAFCGMTWRGAHKLAESPCLSGVKRLNVGGNKIGGSGLQALGQSTHLENLRHLNVISTGVNGKGILSFLGSPLAARLETIDLQGNKFGRPAAQALTARFGDGADFDLLDRKIPCRKRRAHVKAHPPRCLSGFRLKGNTAITQVVLDELLDGNPDYVAFELCPTDPASKPVLLGYDYGESPGGEANDSDMISPLAIRWAPSGEVIELIDCEQHGFTGEFDNNSMETGLGPRDAWECEIEGCNEHRFVAIFLYTDSALVRDFDWYVPLQDQFRWFVLAAWCDRCAEVFCVAEFDCRP